jgi:CRP-like cAMP-binding protein
MEWKEYASVLAKTFLFQNRNMEDYKNQLQKATIVSFLKGQIIYDRFDFEKKMGVILSGRVIVESGQDGKVLLNVMGEAQAFGVAGLFCKSDEYVSRIIAKEDTKVLFLDESILKELFLSDFTITFNYIVFLSDRICFLNERIQTLTGQTAQQKLAAYLYRRSLTADQPTKLSIPFSIKDMAQALDVGRASIYRAFTILEKEGVIRRVNKEVEILDQNSLRTYLDGRIFKEDEGK